MRSRHGHWLSSPWARNRNPFQEMLDEACEVIDEVTVQGVLHRNTAAKRKDSARSRLLADVSRE